ncbi:MAG: hypothetical protein SV966_03625 [Actinomycetota bacterium]|nr:hypothetical protein [Actinomycetota bacterium]
MPVLTDNLPVDGPDFPGKRYNTSLEKMSGPQDCLHATSNSHAAAPSGKPYA